jgi:glutamate transport system permease protein
VDVLIDNSDVVLRGFRTTLALFAVSAVGSLLLGTLLGAMRVSPVPVLRAAGTAYVNVARNTPLVVMFLLIVFCLPVLGIQLSFFVRAVIALTLYTASFVCEAVRSGVNAVSAGQAEAARSVGMTFGQTLGQIVLPQAFRTVIPPLASVFIALAKNTAVAAAFGVPEATFRMKALITAHTDAIYAIFLGFALGYILITLTIAGVARLVESRVAIVR